jgi:hypothetical protein
MPSPRFKKGSPKPPNSGRKPGSVNKVPSALKDMILQALANVGGTAYLEQQATTNPATFMSLIGRVLPLQVKTDGAEPTVPTTVNHIHEKL